MEELSTDSRLRTKFNTISELWTANKQDHGEDDKDWISVLDAIERDITSLNNDYKFKSLIAYVDEKFKE